MKISPTVLIDGHTITPPGWLWVLAFAIRGVPWAVAEVESGRVGAAMRMYYGGLWAGEGI